jgi:hypothetical protein
MHEEHTALYDPLLFGHIVPGVWLGLLLFAAAIVLGALVPGRANKRAEQASTDGDRIEATKQLRTWRPGWRSCCSFPARPSGTWSSGLVHEASEVIPATGR